MLAALSGIEVFVCFDHVLPKRLLVHLQLVAWKSTGFGFEHVHGLVFVVVVIVGCERGPCTVTQPTPVDDRAAYSVLLELSTLSPWTLGRLTARIGSTASSAFNALYLLPLEVQLVLLETLDLFLLPQ